MSCSYDFRRMRLGYQSTAPSDYNPSRICTGQMTEGRRGYQTLPNTRQSTLRGAALVILIEVSARSTMIIFIIELGDTCLGLKLEDPIF
jgi:hypothetical protein